MTIASPPRTSSSRGLRQPVTRTPAPSIRPGPTRPVPVPSRPRRPAQAGAKLSARRLAAVLAVVIAVFAVLLTRLVYVQVVAGKRYAAVGLNQMLQSVVLPATRGELLDRNGNVLETSLSVPTVIADPHLVTNPRLEAAALAPILHRDPATLEQLLSRDSSFVYLARQVDAGLAAQVKGLHLAGVSFIHEPKGFLADSQLALPVLGTVGVDGHGLGGLEYRYDRALSGRAGKVVLERDPNGADIPGGVRSSDAAQPGQSLVLTLDQSMQYATEQALSNEIVASGAKGGEAIVMNSHTGDILAMTSLTAGVNGKPPGPAPSNAAVTSVYEPGSVIKSAMFAGALEDHLISPTTRLSVPGQISLYGSVFHDAEPHGTETLSASDILAQSSNVGTIEIAQMLGKSRLAYYLRDFGLGSLTGLGFPGESPGLLSDPSKWSGTAIAAVPIGQDEAVTPLQVLDIYNTLATGGVAVTPRLVSATEGPDRVKHAVPLAPGRRVVSPQTAQELTSMLEQVVQSPAGTGTAAAITGYTVAGKTGTAQKPLANGRGYQQGAYMATFAGFVPAQSPAITAVVVLDQPTPIFGGAVAAPVFAQIAKYGLRQLDVPPVGVTPGVPVTSATQPAGSAPVRTTD